MAEEEYELNSPEYLNWDTNEDDLKEQADKMKAAQRLRATAYHDVFAKTEVGSKILSEWVQAYCTSAPPDKNASVREVAMNDGKRELVHLILQQIQIGETL